MGKRIGDSTADGTVGFFCRSCLQLITSRNTAVYRYHGIFEMVYYRPEDFSSMPARLNHGVKYFTP